MKVVSSRQVIKSFDGEDGRSVILSFSVDQLIVAPVQLTIVDAERDKRVVCELDREELTQLHEQVLVFLANKRGFESVPALRLTADDGSYFESNRDVLGDPYRVGMCFGYEGVEQHDHVSCFMESWWAEKFSKLLGSLLAGKLTV